MKKIRLISPAGLHFRSRDKYRPVFYSGKSVEIIEQTYDPSNDTVVIIYNMQDARARFIARRVNMDVAQALLDSDRETQRIARQNRRRIRRIPEYAWNNLENPAYTRDPVGESVLDGDDVERLCECIAHLSEHQRRRLIAYYFYGLTYRQIASVENVTHSAIVESVQSALKKIKKILN